MNITHLEPLVYDYSQIADANMRTMAQRAADEIKPRLRRATEDILIIGQRLAVVRQYLPHGQWMAWVEAEFGMDYQTAHNFTRVADRFGDKSINFINLKPSALYMLAAPSTPDEAIAEVESLVTNGHTPTVAETKQIINTVRAGLVPAPVVPAPGKLLVDWTDEDWAAHNARIEAAVAEVADTPPTAAYRGPLMAAIDTAQAWLTGYRGPHGAGWSVMTDNQIIHANSPCFQAWTKAHPEIEHPKEALATALRELRKARPHTQSPNHPITQSPAPSSTDNKALSPDLPSPSQGEGPGVRVPHAVHFTSDSEEHYTPDTIWQAAQRVMGTIYLDPCSNSADQPNIPALRHYTIAEDGLRQYWEGTVFMNPPYGRQIGDWITKLVEAHKTFDVPQAIALLPARVDTQWWQIIRDYPVCFVTGRLKFKGNDDNAAPFPSAIVYLGQRVDQFVKEFAPIGDIWRRIQ